MLEKTLESLLDCKEIKSANPKVNHLEYLLEGLMLLIFWALEIITIECKMCHKRGVPKISGKRECLNSSEGVKERENGERKKRLSQKLNLGKC